MDCKDCRGSCHGVSTDASLPLEDMCYVHAGLVSVLEAGHFIFFSLSCDQTPDTSHLSKKGLTLAGRLRRDTVPQGEKSLEVQTWNRWTGCTCSKETERRQEEKPGRKNPRLSLWPISSRGALLPQPSKNSTTDKKPSVQTHELWRTFHIQVAASRFCPC